MVTIIAQTVHITRKHRNIATLLLFPSIHCSVPWLRSRSAVHRNSLRAGAVLSFGGSSIGWRNTQKSNWWIVSCASLQRTSKKKNQKLTTHNICHAHTLIEYTNLRFTEHRSQIHRHRLCPQPMFPFVHSPNRWEICHRPTKIEWNAIWKTCWHHQLLPFESIAVHEPANLC